MFTDWPVALQGHLTKKVCSERVIEVERKQLDVFFWNILKLRDTQREAIIWKCEQTPKGTERKVRLQRPRGS